MPLMGDIRDNRRSRRLQRAIDVPQGAYGDAGHEVLAALLRCIARYDLANAVWRKQLGISANEHLVIAQLLAIGPLTAAELTTRVGLTSGALTTLVDRLEREELLVRVQDPNDRRRLLLYPTKRLVSLSSSITDQVGAAIQNIAARFNDKERSAIEAVLFAAADVFEQAADGMFGTPRDS